MSKVFLVAALMAFGGCAPAGEDPAPAEGASPADAVGEILPEAAPADTMARDTAGM